jgi:hypothetical protein
MLSDIILEEIARCTIDMVMIQDLLSVLKFKDSKSKFESLNEYYHYIDNFSELTDRDHIFVIYNDGTQIRSENFHNPIVTQTLVDKIDEFKKKIKELNVILNILSENKELEENYYSVKNKWHDFLEKSIINQCAYYPLKCYIERLCAYDRETE